MAERLAASRLAAAPSGDDYADRSAFPTRLLAYLLDSLVLFVFAMLFAALAGVSMLLNTDGGDQAITATDQWLTIAIFLLAMPAWLLFSLVLGLKRHQTVGQYVLGLRMVDEDGGSPALSRLLGYWLALHPLLFHPLFGLTWLLLAWAALLSEVVFVVSLALAILCLAAPIAGLLLALADPQHRTIHDRLAGIRVVRLE